MFSNPISQKGTPTIGEKSGDALFTRMSSAPCSLPIRSNTFDTCASSPWSHCSGMPTPPSSAISLAAAAMPGVSPSGSTVRAVR